MKLYRLSYLAGGLLTVASGLTWAAPADLAARVPQVDDFVRSELQRQKVPGLAVAIVGPGGVVSAKGYGYANVEHDVPVTDETIFQSGSVGKQFTAVAVMMQVEEGKVALDDPITKYFTDAPASWRAITVRNLLTHTSGIPEYTNEGGGAAAVDLRRDYTEAEMQHIAYKMQLDFKPGTRWSYSNTGYVMLGILVRQVSGKFYGDVLKERVFGPLGMPTARIISEADIVPHRAAGYRLEHGQLKNQEWVAPMLNTTADGSLYLSLRDLVAWDQGLRRGALLRPSSWAEIYTPVRLASGRTYPYGFGWSIESSSGAPWYHHSGSWQGFQSYISRYVGEGITIIVLANLAGTDTTRIVDGVAQILDPKLALLEPVAAIADHEPAVTARVRALLEQAALGKLPHDQFSASIGDFPEVSKQATKDLQAIGPIQRLDLLQRRDYGDDRTYTYAVVGKQSTRRLSFGLAPDDKVSMFELYEY